LKSAEVLPKGELFQAMIPRTDMDPDNAGPLSESETVLLDEGLHRFDTGQFWHAHESWEDLWNSLKHRNAPQREILLVQGMIQTAAMLLHHQRKNAIGVSKQWAKLHPKLEGWGVAWGLDVASHLRVIESYANDGGAWNLVATNHQVPRA
jgi:hypothetical protein